MARDISDLIHLSSESSGEASLEMSPASVTEIHLGNPSIRPIRRRLELYVPEYGERDTLREGREAILPRGGYGAVEVRSKLRKRYGA